MKLRLIMPLLVIVAAFLFTDEVTGQTNGTFNNLTVRNQARIMGTTYIDTALYLRGLKPHIVAMNSQWVLLLDSVTENVYKIKLSSLADSVPIPAQYWTFVDAATDTLKNNVAISGGIIYIDSASIELDKTSSTSGQIKQNGDRIIHTFSNPSYPVYPNLFIGRNAGNFSTTGYGNLAVGTNALDEITGGDYAIAIGHDALDDNTDGYNIAMGYQSQQKSTVGFQNVAVGIGSLQYNTAGSYNTAIGGFSMRGDPGTIVGNTAVGYDALTAISGGALYNVALGTGAGKQLTTGDSNVFIGQLAGFPFTTESNRLVIENTQSATPLIYGEFDNDSIRFNADIAISGDVWYEDTFWDDITFPASQIKLGATAKPDYDFDELSLLFPYSDSTEMIVANVQTPHRWSAGSGIYVHVHWIQSGANDTAEFILKYRWTDMGETQSASFTRIETTVCTYYTYVSGDLHQLAIFPVISGAGHTESSILDFKLFRKEDIGLNGDIEVKDFDIHYEIDKPGSDNQTP